MSGFAPDPAELPDPPQPRARYYRTTERMAHPPGSSQGPRIPWWLTEIDVDPVQQAAKIAALRIALCNIRDGLANPKIIARVALGELPIGALLASDPEVFCLKCENRGRRVKGPHNQQLPCNSCGYLPGEHPAEVHPLKGASS